MTDIPIILDHDQWEKEWYRIYNLNMNNDPGRRVQYWMQYASQFMEAKYGKQPAKIYKEGEEPGNIFKTIGSVIVAPVKVIKVAIKGVQLVNSVKDISNNMFKLTFTSVITALIGFFGAFGAAWSGQSTHDIGGILSAVVAGVVAVVTALKTTRPEIKS